ncbi:MAG: cysteine hydrolase [Hyphomicrobiaceae bacterium]
MSSLYLVLDLINDIVTGTSPLVAEVERRGVLARSAEAIAKARAAGVPIAYVRVGFSGEQDRPRCSPFLRPFYDAGYLQLGARGTQVHAAVTPQPGDLDIVKHRVSAFWGTELDMILRARGIDKIYVSGVSTTYAVSSTVREAHDRDLDIVLIEDLCAAGSLAEHEAAIAALSPLCGTVTGSAEVVFA